MLGRGNGKKILVNCSLQHAWRFIHLQRVTADQFLMLEDDPPFDQKLNIFDLVFQTAITNNSSLSSFACLYVCVPVWEHNNSNINDLGS